MPQRRRGKGRGGGQFLPGPRAVDVDAGEELSVNEFVGRASETLYRDPSITAASHGVAASVREELAARARYAEYMEIMDSAIDQFPQERDDDATPDGDDEPW